MNTQEPSGSRREPTLRVGFTPAWASRRSKHQRELRQPPTEQPESPHENARGLNAYLLRKWAEPTRD